HPPTGAIAAFMGTTPNTGLSWSAGEALIESAAHGTPPSSPPLNPQQADQAYNDLDAVFKRNNPAGDFLDPSFWKTPLGKALQQDPQYSKLGSTTSLNALENWLKKVVEPEAMNATAPGGAIYTYFYADASTKAADTGTGSGQAPG